MFHFFLKYLAMKTFQLHLSPSSFLRVTLVVLCCASWGMTAGKCTAW